MKNIIIILIALLFSAQVRSETRDSIVVTKITVPVKHDTTYVVTHDSTYFKTDTFKIIVEPPVTLAELRGAYIHPDEFVLGDQLSENVMLTKYQRLGFNMLNLYNRSKLYTSSDRDKLARFVKKAKEQFGMILITVDVRLTDSREYQGWVDYYAKYGGTISMIEPLAEFEPYRKNAAGIYPYADFFILLQKMDALTKKYGAVLNWYEGWIGKYYANPQAAVDSMVLHCGRIFISNYVSMSDYNSTNPSLGIWDSRMTKRIDQGGYESGVLSYGGIVVSCKKLNKVIDLVEIQSLEEVFLLSLYSCPATSTKKCKTFFGSVWEATKAKYNLSNADVLKWTNLVGKTIFYSKEINKTGQ